MTDFYEKDIDNVFNDLNNDITKLLNSRLTPLIKDLKLATTNLDIIKNILFSLPEYKSLIEELERLKIENLNLKEKLNESNIKIEISEKSILNNTSKSILDYNIEANNKIINFSNDLISNETLNDLSSEEEEESDSDSLETDDEDLESTNNKLIVSSIAKDMQENSDKILEYKELNIKNDKKISRESDEESDEESQEESEEESKDDKHKDDRKEHNTKDDTKDNTQDDKREEDDEDKEEEEEEEGEEEEEEEEEKENESKEDDKENDKEEEEDDEEEDEEVFEIEINGKTYFTTSKENGIVYEYLIDEDDIGDKVGEYKDGILIWKKK